MVILLMFYLLIGFFIPVYGEKENADEFIELESPGELEEAISENGNARFLQDMELHGHQYPKGTTYEHGKGFDLPSEGPMDTNPHTYSYPSEDSGLPDESSIKIDDDSKIAGKGIDIREGQILEGEQIVIDTGEEVAEGSYINKLDMKGNEYTIGTFDYWGTFDTQLINGENLERIDNSLKIGEAELIKHETGGSVYGVTDLESEGESFSLRSAKSVMVEGALFDDIKESYFETKDGELIKAHIKSNKENNTFVFNGIEVNIDKEDSIKITKNEITNKYNISLDSLNGSVNDKYAKVFRVNLSPGSRYKYTGYEYDNYAIFVPSYGNYFVHFQRTLEQESIYSGCDNCGVKDFVNYTAELNGIYQYERLSAFEEELFRNMVDASANYSIDAENQNFNNTNITFFAGNGIGTFSHFEIIEKENGETCTCTSYLDENNYIFENYINPELTGENTLKGTMQKLHVQDVSVHGPEQLQYLKDYKDEII